MNERSTEENESKRLKDYTMKGNCEKSKSDTKPKTKTKKTDPMVDMKYDKKKA